MLFFYKFHIYKFFGFINIVLSYRKIRVSPSHNTLLNATVFFFHISLSSMSEPFH